MSVNEALLAALGMSRRSHVLFAEQPCAGVGVRAHAQASKATHRLRAPSGRYTDAVGFGQKHAVKHTHSMQVCWWRIGVCVWRVSSWQWPALKRAIAQEALNLVERLRHGSDEDGQHEMGLRAFMSKPCQGRLDEEQDEEASARAGWVINRRWSTCRHEGADECM